MGTCHASVVVLRTWYLWFKGHVLLRLFGKFAALFTLWTSPATVSFVLHRLSTRLLVKTFICMQQESERHDMSSNLYYIGGAENMHRDRAPPAGARKGAVESKRSSLSSSSTAVTASSIISRPNNAPSLPSPRLPMPHSRSKTASHVDVVKQGHRLSLQFPIQPAAGSNSTTASPRSRPQSWVAASPVLSPGADSPTPDILAVLASQERYVLELKEELNKAEADLKTLKRHYANHEANKRRNDNRKVAPLQPVNTLIDLSPDNEEEEGSKTPMQLEIERKKALLANTKSSQRKVFSGSRHLRTLSLLSPDKSFTPSFLQPSDLQAEEPSALAQEPSARSSTSSDLMRPSVDSTNSERYEIGNMPNIQRDQIIRAGTQMATDLKNGLFTFIEDIRQATVGDEAVHGPNDGSVPATARDGSGKPIRKASTGRPAQNRSTSSKKSAARLGSTGDDFWRENGLSEPKTAPVNNKKTHTNKPAQTPQKQTRTVEEEEWDNWETPNDTFGARTVDAQDSSDESDGDVSGTASSRTSTRYHSKRHDSKASSLTTTSSTGYPEDAAPRDPKRNSIPWPDLVKLSPNNLKRTASHLMKEWEKQLTPPPESRQSSHSTGDYIGRSDAPATGLL